MNKNITFRTQLVGGVSEFCAESNLPLIHNNLHLVELIVMLARYQEEGVSLCPKVYLTDDVKSMTSMLPGGDVLKIGECNLDIPGLKDAVKKCAPLANEGWLIYLTENDGKIEFGLFRGPTNPISVRVDDVLMTQNEQISIVKVHQIATDCVGVHCNNGSGYNIFLNHRKEDSKDPLESFDALVSAMTDKTAEKQVEPITTFLSKLLIESLRNSHGCLIAVTPHSHLPESLSQDGVFFEKPIDFAELVELASKSEIDAADLVSKASLLQGMLNSDGIVLFDNKARVLGYNCFVNLNGQSGRSINGGARKRAFGALSAKIGDEFSAIFIQSQDGWSEYKGV
ncbi:hypothetical protein G5Y08_004251 [Vibrio parahaemolyticus]|nr:hypothetical protein [Vibrio parahaemolyticus]EGQ8107139.1 hypothetical protein [Vibrio parahaemolyticus]EHD2277607.1 hypothetical protein [Vibrio parahaemolyticus]EHH2498340.1 hypothetical protein [Vibrio parahaemolyticus]EID4328241.1 hypothetical protein [Vibrio parahaemolyticus]